MIFKNTIIFVLIIIFYLLHFYWNRYRGGEEISKSQELYIHIISILLIIIIVVIINTKY